jgi:hypothetical protein
MMTVFIEFNLDTRTEQSSVKIQSPFADVKATRDNLNERLDEVAKGSKALMPIRDADTGDFVFVNTMKIGSIDVFEE